MQFTMYMVYEEQKNKNKDGFVFDSTPIPFCFVHKFQNFEEAYKYVAEQANGNSMTEYVTHRNHLHYRFCERTDYKNPQIWGFYHTRQFCIVPELITIDTNEPMVGGWVGGCLSYEQRKLSNIV